MIKLFQYVFGYAPVILEDVAEYQKDRINAEEVDETNYVGVDNLLQNKQGKKNSDHLPLSGKLTKYHKGDILIGNIRPYLKKIWFADYEGGTNGDVLDISIKDNSFLESKYLYYVLSSDHFFTYDMQNSKGAKMPRGDKRLVMNYSFELPSKEKQTEIANTLDHFDHLCNDLSSGLPAEINARQKQYEYYRDQLLTFKEKQV